MRDARRTRPAVARVAGLLLALLGTAAVLVATACTGSPLPAPASTRVPPGTPSTAPLQGSITVFAAASLSDAFTEAGKAFEAANPGTKVAFSFGASSTLAVQINEGAPANVFASADGAQMKVVTSTGVAEAPVEFATNVPVVVVPAGSKVVRSFQDLAKPGIKLILAAPAVPIGNYAREILAKASAGGAISPNFAAQVLANLKSNEANVRSVLAKIQTGEGDAGIVYTTDAATAAKQVTQIPIPRQYNVVAKYPMAVLKHSSHVDVARAFERFIVSGPGRAILTKYGFGSPGPA